MIQRWIAGAVLGLFAVSASAISPYIQGDPVAAGSVQAVASAVEAKLRNEGFKIAGRYFPRSLAGYGVVIATDDAMLSEVGAVGGHAVLGSAIRIGVKADGSVAVFGVAMNEGENSDGEWIKRIDMQNNIAGLPYEIYINNKHVEAPHGRFRIALAFPDVGMGQFMRVSSLPNAIMDAMSNVAGVDKKTTGDAW